MFFRPILILALLSPLTGIGQGVADSALYGYNDWTLHFQQTVIGQYHPSFASPYEGKNSQLSSEPAAVSVTSTVFLGRRLWDGAELYFNPELSGGKGVGQTLGIAGFPNGETYRIGDPQPVVAMVRLFLRQTIYLGAKNSQNADGQNTISGPTSDKKLVFTVGKFSVTDIFDNNAYSHDPRSQFMNWALMSAGAWDYPADTKGYTWGGVGELFFPGWSMKLGISMVPSYANGPQFDDNVTKANSVSGEFDHDIHLLLHRPGTLRLIGFYTHAHMGNYAEATNDTQYHHDITQTREYGRTKEGFVINLDQQISDVSGLFARISYNDGLNETWAFTEIDRSVALGYSLKGTGWKRPDDVFGAAVVVNGLSPQHEAYLAAGGYGFIIGDGQLNYGFESILETYYNFKWGNYLFLSPDYQFVLNPAYNKDRGPINLFGLRAHVEF